MEQIYYLSIEIGAELLPRSKAVALAKRIDSKAQSVKFDFGGVLFVSRSFADELCNIAEKFGERVSFVNMTHDIEEMINIVSEGRKRGREKGHNPAKFFEFNDVESLSKFMAESC